MRQLGSPTNENRTSRYRVIGLGLAALVAPQAAQAQETVLVAPPALPDYDRGRNVSVVEQPRPDYDAIGVRRGSFLIYPRLDLSGGASDNVYLTSDRNISDVFAVVAPSVYATSDWSRHQISLGGGTTLRRYADESPRNQDEWSVNALGRADLGSAFALTVEGQAARTQESPFSGAVQASVAALSAYQRRTAIVRGQYTLGRSRATLTYDYNRFSFSDITFTDDSRLSQRDRDREIHRGTGQVEYALSPSLSIYGQAAYAKTDYARTLLTGQANRDSNAFRLIAGANLDLSAFLRGTVGVGYVQREYSSALYRDVGGISVEAKIEYFPTTLTTVTFNLRRVLDDANIGNSAAYFDNQAGLRVDHALLDNLLLHATVGYTHQDYLNSSISSDIFRVEGGGRYLVSRSVELNGSLGYGGRSQSDVIGGGKVNETAGQLGVVLKR